MTFVGNKHHLKRLLEQMNGTLAPNLYHTIITIAYQYIHQRTSPSTQRPSSPHIRRLLARQKCWKRSSKKEELDGGESLNVT